MELLNTGTHTVTALARPDSKSRLPEGVKVVHLDYNDESTLVAALQGQQFLIITMFVMAPRDTHSQFVQPAAKAGIPYMIPNCYGTDIAKDSLSKEKLLDNEVRLGCAEFEATGVSSWITLVCSL